MTILELLLTASKPIILIFGSGYAIKLLLIRNQNQTFIYGSALCCVLGMTFLAFSGYFLSQIGVFSSSISQAYLYVLVVFILAYFLRWLIKHPLQSSNKVGLQNLLPFFLDLILIVLLLPTFILAAVTPIIDGDGLYSFNTWAMHWALRDDMSDYWFMAYGQLMSITASWVYKLSLPWQGGIPIEQHLLHAFYVFSTILGLLMVRRIPAAFTGHWVGSLLGFGCAVLLLLQEDIHSTLISGKAEPIVYLFEALIIFELAMLHEAKTSDMKVPYRLGVLIAGLVFIKPSVVPLGVFFLLTFYLLEMKNNLKVGTTLKSFLSNTSPFVYSILRRSLAAPLVAVAIVLVLSGPFYAFQYRHIGDVGYSHPANMSFGGGTILNSSKGATGEMRNSFIINSQTTSDLQLFVYRITEVFMPYKDRGKKLWEGIQGIEIALALLIIIGFILSFRFSWLWPLHLAAITHTGLWYVYASFAYYDLTPGIILYVTLAGIGYVKLFEAPAEK